MNTIHELLWDLDHSTRGRDRFVTEDPDFRKRDVHAAVLRARYGNPSLIVVSVNGTPPRLTVLIQTGGEGGQRCWMRRGLGGFGEVVAEDRASQVEALARFVLEDEDVAKGTTEHVYEGEEQ